MIKRLRWLFIAIAILTLILVGWSQASVAYEAIRSVIASQDSALARVRDVEVAALVQLAMADLEGRGIEGKVWMQSVEPTEFPDGSLGAPEPNKPYPLAVTPGYSINLQVDRVVYRYWAANGRVVYVGSYVEPAD